MQLRISDRPFHLAFVPSPCDLWDSWVETPQVSSSLPGNLLGPLRKSSSIKPHGRGPKRQACNRPPGAHGATKDFFHKNRFLRQTLRDKACDKGRLLECHATRVRNKAGATRGATGLKKVGVGPPRRRGIESCPHLNYQKGSWQRRITSFEVFSKLRNAQDNSFATCHLDCIRAQKPARCYRYVSLHFGKMVFPNRSPKLNLRSKFDIEGLSKSPDFGVVA